MRLICPKCEAQYEVDDGVIPAAGRDVQCSNCSTTWFQTAAAVVGGKARPEPASAKAAIEPVAAPAASVVEESLAEEASRTAPETAPEPEAMPTTTEPMPETRPDPVPEPMPDPVPAMDAAVNVAVDEAEDDQSRRAMDDSVITILREEADRETKARKSDSEALDYEAELGLAVMAAIAADTKLSQDQDETGKSGRRSVLPDIDQINSTLRATSDRITEATDASDTDRSPHNRAGFRRGFVTILAMAMVLLGIYVSAPKLAERFPAAKPALTVYVTQVDSGRIWVDARMQKLTAWVQTEIGKAQN